MKKDATIKRIIRNQKLNKLKDLMAKAKALRKSLGISAPNEVTYQGDLGDDDKVVVTADGLGGAELEIVEGNFPVDYQRKRGKTFASEDEATERASQILDYVNGDTPEANLLRKTYSDLSGLYDSIFGKE